MDVRMFTVGPFAENTYIFRADEDAGKALVVDPGDEAEKILGAIEGMGVEVEGILLTHCHIDHVGALAAVAKATGAPVWCPEEEADWIRDINTYQRWPGLGPFEDHDPENLVTGGEALELAGFDIDVIHTPGHSPGHVTYSIPGETAVFSGDVLFQGSVGRVDLPGGDPTGRTLMESIRLLLDDLPDETKVHPGHMGLTTLGAERATNPFLTELV